MRVLPRCLPALGLLGLACTKPERKPEPETEPETPVVERKPEPEPDPESPADTTAPVSLELVAERDGFLDLLTTEGELFVRIEGQVLPVVDGQPVYEADKRKTRGWRWPPLFETDAGDPHIREEVVQAFGGSAQRPVLALSLTLAGYGMHYGVYQLGGRSVRELKPRHRELVGFYTDVAGWGDRVVGLRAWVPPFELYRLAFRGADSDEELAYEDAMYDAIGTAPDGFELLSGRGGEPPSLGDLVPMGLATDEGGTLHAIAHAVPADFNPHRSVEDNELYADYEVWGVGIGVGLLGAEVERYTTHDYVHLIWRPGQLKPEQAPVPGLGQAQVAGMSLTSSAAIGLSAILDGGAWWLGVLDASEGSAEGWRVLPSDRLPVEAPGERWEPDIAPALTIDGDGTAWLIVAGELWSLGPDDSRWTRRELPATPIAEREPEVYFLNVNRGGFDLPPRDRRRDLPKDRAWSQLWPVELAWAEGELWLVCAVGSTHIDLLFRLRGDAPTPSAVAGEAVRLPSSASIYVEQYAEEIEDMAKWARE